MVKNHLDRIETTEGPQFRVSAEIHCPRCGDGIKGAGDEPLAPHEYGKSKRKCPSCGESLWVADNSSHRRIAISDYIAKHMKGFFDLLIADEVHELKGGTSAQGLSFGVLCSSVKKVLCLTGTLVGGYADDLFYILFRLFPQKLIQAGFNYSDVTKWNATYGCLESVTKEKDAADHATSRGKQKVTTQRRKPGISPMVFGKFLLENCVFLELSDISDNLPDIHEEVISTAMKPVHADAYKECEDELRKVIDKQLAMGNKGLLGILLHSLMSYADNLFEDEPIYSPDGDLLYEPEIVDETVLTSKEESFIEIAKEEIKQGRNVLCYVTYTNKRPMHKRLISHLKKCGIQSEFMPSTIKPESREGWVHKSIKKGNKCLFVHPECVKTGLDLLMFPTIVFFQTGYNTFTLRQASRRSWRIGQEREVKVLYLASKNTIQEQALSLMGKKLEASMALEGKFSEQGLQSMTSGEDMSTALAKALVKGLDDSSGIEQAWANINTKNKGTGVKSSDGALYDCEQLMKVGWNKDQIDAYFKAFPNEEQRRQSIELLVQAYQARVA